MAAVLPVKATKGLRTSSPQAFADVAMASSAVVSAMSSVFRTSVSQVADLRERRGDARVEQTARRLGDGVR